MGELNAAIEGFLVAFRNLDWEPFRASFAEDATVFFPQTAGVVERADGKGQIEEVFSRVFERARAQKAEPPYLHIEPSDVRIQSFGNVAIVTFHLDDPGVFGRRSVVFENREGQWLIVHLHASNVS